MSAAENHWRVYKNSLLSWTASVPLHASAPRDLLDWTLGVVQLAEATEIVRFRKEDGTYWPRNELSAHLERTLEERSVVDAFAFSNGFDRLGSKIAFHDEAGVHEALIDDVDALRKRLCPREGDQYDHPRRLPPLFFGGHAISFAPDATRMSAQALPSTSVTLDLPCDIWFPWVPGFDTPDREVFYDNRSLAERHTPRFNRFLGGLRTSVLDRGGTWELTYFRGEKWISRMLDAEGIDLSAAAPPMVLEHGPLKPSVP